MLKNMKFGRIFKQAIMKIVKVTYVCMYVFKRIGNKKK